jgi:hypothetical protein
MKRLSSVFFGILIAASLFVPAIADVHASTYINSKKETVSSPVRALVAPKGASARCKDGTYSFSKSRSGTCSHHGGVRAWLK